MNCDAWKGPYRPSRASRVAMRLLWSLLAHLLVALGLFGRVLGLKFRFRVNLNLHVSMLTRHKTMSFVIEAEIITGQGPGLVNVLSQREWLRVDQFQHTHCQRKS